METLIGILILINIVLVFSFVIIRAKNIKYKNDIIYENKMNECLSDSLESINIISRELKKDNKELNDSVDILKNQLSFIEEEIKKRDIKSRLANN